MQDSQCRRTRDVLERPSCAMHTRRPTDRARRTITTLVVTVVALVSLAGRAQAQQAATTEAKPFAAFSASAENLRDSLVALARAQLGRRYVRGGTSPDRGFDCSGLIKYIAEALHLDVPRTARLQARSGLAVARDTSRLRPGDLLTFGRRRQGVSHIGIYIGGGRFIHASTVAGKVIESRLDRAPAPRIKPWLGARRLLPDDTVRIASRP